MYARLLRPLSAVALTSSLAVAALRLGVAAPFSDGAHMPSATMLDTNVAARAHGRAGLLLEPTPAVRFRPSAAPAIAQAFSVSKLAEVEPVAVHETLGEALFRFATGPFGSTLLLTLALLGLLLEMHTLHGIAGLIGVGALALFFSTHVAAGFAGSPVVVLAALGLVAILLELHVVPGHGVLGGLGVLALGAGIVLAFGLPFIVAGVQAVAFAIVLSLIAFALSSRVLPESALFRRIAFLGTQGVDYVTAEDHRGLVGHIGVAASYLRPAGIASVEGKRVDVLTEGDFVAAGTPVEVTRVEGARVFVRPTERTGPKTKEAAW